MKKLSVPLAILFFFLGLYVFLQSPGITGGDGGGLVTAAALRGVAHPPGYPLYTLLGWFLTRLPFNLTPAFKVGLLSSLPAAFSVLVVFLMAKKISGDRLIGLIASLSLAFNYLFWLEAETQEVFSLHLIFLFLALLIALCWREKQKKSYLVWLALIVGLEFAHHHTFVLIFPALFYLFFLADKTKIKLQIGRKLVVLLVGAFLLGALFYLYVPLLAKIDSPASWTKITDLGEMSRLILRSDYGTFSAGGRLGFNFANGLLAQIALLNFMVQEFAFLGLGLIILGLVKTFKKDKILFNFLFLWFLFTGPVFQFVAGFPIGNWFVLATTERFYLLFYPTLFVWFIFGLVYSKELVFSFLKRTSFLRPKVLPFLMSLFLLYPFWLLMINLPKNNFRNFYEFDLYGERLLASCPRDSVMLVEGDQAMFSLLYARYVKKTRPNVLLFFMDNPRRSVLLTPQLADFSHFFLAARPAMEDFWKEFAFYIADRNLSVCSLEKVEIGSGYSFVPRGLVNLYDQEEKNPEEVFSANVRLWNDFGLSYPLESPKYEAFFAKHLLETYHHRAFSLSQYFFEVKDYEKTRYWLERAQVYYPDSEMVQRAALLVDIKQGNCDLAKIKLEEHQFKAEEENAWPLARAVYEKECLGQEENYNRLWEGVKGRLDELGLDVSDVAEMDEEEKIEVEKER